MRLWRAKERRVTTARVTFNGAVLAESDQTVVIEGNHYFPPKSVKWEHLTENASHTTCWWKGEASYYDIKVDGEVSASAGWVYHEPSEAAERIGDYVAFYRHKVTIEG